MSERIDDALFQFTFDNHDLFFAWSEFVSERFATGNKVRADIMTMAHAEKHRCGLKDKVDSALRKYLATLNTIMSAAKGEALRLELNKLRIELCQRSEDSLPIRADEKHDPFEADPPEWKRARDILGMIEGIIFESNLEKQPLAGTIPSAEYGPFTTAECREAWGVCVETWRNWYKGKACPKGLAIRSLSRGRWMLNQKLPQRTPTKQKV